MLVRRNLWFLGLFVSLLPAWMITPTSGPERADAKAPAAVAFPHSKHVPREWLDYDEAARDCQGCHRFDVDATVEAGLPQPEATCDACHYPVNGRPSVSVTGSLAETKRRTQAFPTFAHGDHTDMDCKSCHLDPKASPDTVPDDIWIPTGMGTCLNCHDQSRRSFAAANGMGQWVDQANRGDAGARFSASLNRHPGMRKSGPATFRHEDHLAPGELANGKRCGECHENMSAAGAAIGEAVFTTKDCGACHVDSSKQALAVATESRSGTSRSDLTFLHSDHLPVDGPAKGRIGRDGCFACHKHDPAGTTHSYPVLAELETFDGCVKCHDADKVVGRSGTTDWGIAGRGDLAPHGDVGCRPSDGNTCVDCHVVGDFAAPLKTARPMREAKRRRPTVFTITEQVHPHMTGSKEVKHKECADCHIAEVDRIPSRIRGVAFDHDSHLPPEPTSQDCLPCHRAQSPKDGGMMQMEAPEVGALTYDELSCRQCHRGVKREDQRFRAADFRDKQAGIVTFDHNDHVKMDGKDLACAVCHVELDAAQQAAQGRYFTEPADVATCVKCHDHKEHFELCNKAGDAYVKSCVDCHEVHTKGLPQPGEAYPIAWPRVTSLSGTQFHPAPDAQACADCHRTAVFAMETRLGNVQCDLSFKDEEIHKQSEYPQQCYACHWGDPQNVSSSNVGKILDENGALVPNSRRFNTSRLRSTLGERMKNYPGGRAR